MITRTGEWLYLRLLRYTTSVKVSNNGRKSISMLETLKFKREVSLGPRGSQITIPIDNVIYNRVATFGDWEEGEADFLAKQITRIQDSWYENPTLLDLGANVGLVTIQIARRVRIPIKVILVEALPLHVQALKLNMESNCPNGDVQICEFALGTSEGTIDFFTEIGNQGNSSSKLDAMQSQKFKVSTVRMISARRFFQDFLDTSTKIVLKSDLQGSDAEILANIPTAAWSQLNAGVVEVWAIDSVSISSARLVSNRFGDHFRLSWDPNFNTEITSTELFQFWSCKSGEHRNLFFEEVSRAKGVARL